MINFDDPSIAVALLAIIIGLRLALYLVERTLNARAAETVEPVLSPDETADESLLPLADAPESEPVSHPSRQETHSLRFITEILDSAMIAVFLVFFLIRPFILQAFYIPSDSMVPTLLHGDKLLATKFTYHLREPRRGEVIVFHAPKDALETLGQKYDPKHPTDYVKRLVGLPGDRIHIVDGEGVFVNGALFDKPGSKADTPNYDFPTDVNGNVTPETIRYEQVREKLQPDVRGNDLVVPPGYLFVLGDNRTMSHDSHAWGFVPRKDVVGKAVFLFWPPNRMGFVH